MYDDSELIAISPRNGLWEVNGKEGLTMEQALAEVREQMLAWKPEPEYVTVMDEQQCMFARMGQRMAEKILPCLSENPYLRLLSPNDTKLLDGMKWEP